ncbi:MAG: hydrogenase maturation protease [bacterium]|nr:hydrogenase maturation protease [bacterium]
MSIAWRDAVERFLGLRAGRRIVLVGVGNTLRGDDGAGSVLAARLRAAGKRLAFDAGAAPENHAGPVAASSPETVIIADAARFGGAAGEARLFAPGRLAPGGLSTHDPSAALLARYLGERCGCEVVILGIEPASAKFGDGLGREAEASVAALEAILAPHLA